MDSKTLVPGLALALGLGSLLSACDYQGRDVPPPNLEIGNSIGQMYLRAGVGTEVVKGEVLGKHYQPASDSWKVIACTEFAMADGGTGRDCNDSFELYKLDSGTWLVSGTVSGGYLWLQIP